jgi:tRNA(fMet)-specific endonuclease VapC
VTLPSRRVLLDTNVLVLLIRGGSAGERIDSDHGLRERTERPLISVITVGEMEALAIKLGWNEAKVNRLRELIGELVVVHPHQGEVIEKYAAIDYFSEKEMKPARPMAQNDMWIAATASASKARLMTTDSDFDHLDGRFLDVAKLDPRTGESVSSG